MKGKKAAFEMSMTTIIVVVLSLLLLIMGFVLIRNIMCGAVTATDSLNKGVTGYINDLFGSTGGDVTCLGAGDSVTLSAGEPQAIWCLVKAGKTEQYTFDIEVNERFSTINKNKINDWLGDDSLVRKSFSPSDREPKKIYNLNIPKSAEEGNIAFDVTVKLGNEQVWTGTLTYKVEQPGAVQGFLLC